MPLHDNDKCANTWLVIVEHEEEVDQPRQVHRLEHLPGKSQPAKVYNKPGRPFCSFFKSKMFDN